VTDLAFFLRGGQPVPDAGLRAGEEGVVCIIATVLAFLTWRRIPAAVGAAVAFTAIETVISVGFTGLMFIGLPILGLMFLAYPLPISAPAIISVPTMLLFVSAIRRARG
jgi:hypothetical protein